MALPTIFATQPTGNVPASDLDVNFNAVAAMAITQSAASGTNGITLTPAANQPPVSAYANYQQFSFLPAAIPTGSVSLQVGALASLPLYYTDGKTQASIGAFTTVQLVVIAYNSALNSGSGGFHIVNVTNLSQVPGTTTNDSAAAGNIGEYISSSVTGVAIANNTITNITTISLTPGDWDVWGLFGTTAAPSTTQTILQAWISTVSATSPPIPNNGGISILNTPIPAGQQIFLPVGMQRIPLAVTTTIYLTGFSVYQISTLTANGFIGARRPR